MIIDNHTHLMSDRFIAHPYWDSWTKVFAALSRKPVDLIQNRLVEFWDETGKTLIKDMDDAGIDQSWISVLDLGLVKTVGEAKYSITELNQIYAKIAAESNNRLIAFVGIDPRREEAVRILETGVKEWGMKGLKLIPAAGFYPNDESCYRLYAKARDLRIPVLVHTGPETIPLYSKYCRPIYLDEVANDFPELNLIQCHAGFCWWEEATELARCKPNLFIDLAGWQPQTAQRPLQDFYSPLRHILDTIGASKVLFGSDWPAYRLFRGGQNSWVKVFSNPPDDLKANGITFQKSEIDAILGGNAERLISKL